MICLDNKNLSKKIFSEKLFNFPYAPERFSKMAPLVRNFPEITLYVCTEYFVQNKGLLFRSLDFSKVFFNFFSWNRQNLEVMGGVEASF